jgi:hypothetical protein
VRRASLFRFGQLESFAEGFRNNLRYAQTGVPFGHQTEQRDDVQMLV